MKNMNLDSSHNMGIYQILQLCHNKEELLKIRQIYSFINNSTTKPTRNLKFWSKSWTQKAFHILFLTTNYKNFNLEAKKTWLRTRAHHLENVINSIDLNLICDVYNSKEEVFSI